MAGQFEPERGEQWCARRLLARIHGYTRDRKRAEVRPISQEEWQDFLQSWWHAAPGTRRAGRAGVAEVIEQLQGFELPAGEWERLFAERVESYRPEWLDDLCLSGEVAWGRLSVVEPAAESDDPAAGEPRRSGKTPSRRTPISFMLEQDLRGCSRPTAGPRYRPNRPPAPGERCSTHCAGAARCSTRRFSPSHIASPQRSKKACGTASPGD